MEQRYVDTQTYTDSHLHRHTHTCTHVFTHTWKHTITHIQTHTHAHMQKYAQVHTYTQTHSISYINGRGFIWLLSSWDEHDGVFCTLSSVIFHHIVISYIHSSHLCWSDYGNGDGDDDTVVWVVIADVACINELRIDDKVREIFLLQFVLSRREWVGLP